MASKRTDKPKVGRPRGAVPSPKPRGLRLPADVDDRVNYAVEQANARDPFANATRTSVIVGLIRTYLGERPKGGA